MSSRAAAPFEIFPGDPSSRCIVHVPHSSTSLPPDVRRHLLLNDDELADELRHMTDALTDQLALAAAERAAVRPWLFVNRLSRLVVDPERFPDDREQMASVGMGAIYTSTSHRRPLRNSDPPWDQDLLERYFHPYADALAGLVDERLEQTGSALLLELHSYPTLALPYDLHQKARRAALCLGIDDLQTPSPLLRWAELALADVGDIGVDEPSSGPTCRCGTTASTRAWRRSWSSCAGTATSTRTASCAPAQRAAAGIAAVAGWCGPFSDVP